MSKKLISIQEYGSFSKIEKFLNRNRKLDIRPIMEKYGKIGVNELKKWTPVDTGNTAESWGFYIEDDGETATITWINENVQNSVNIALILQYGHATGTGGWVEGTDYINPALAQAFTDMVNDIWEEVVRK